MVKFGRNYILNIGTPSGTTLTIQPPFTMEFDITRNTLTSANNCSIRIINLSNNHRNQIRFNKMDSGDFRPVQLIAGYGNNLSTIFNGNITQAWSARESDIFVTTLECFDGGYAFNNGFTTTTFPAGTSRQSVVNNLASSLPNVTKGSIGSYPGTLARGIAVNGVTADVLGSVSGGGLFIDNGKVNCLGDNECLPGELQIINSSSGLLGTPIREATILTLDMIFEPRLVVGQQIQLLSSTGANYNGFHKIISLKHRGVISGAVAGDCITTVGMFLGTAALSTVTS